MSVAELPVAQMPEFVIEAPAPVFPAPLNDDEMNLASYEGKLTLIRDYVRGVVLRFATGFFLCGNGGISKSHTVLNELEKLGADYKLFNSRMSGRGLFQALAEYPNTTHVLEDMERIVGDKDTQGVLRSALWSQRGEDGKLKRVVTWSTARGIESICFTGGIISPAGRPAGIKGDQDPNQPLAPDGIRPGDCLPDAANRLQGLPTRRAGHDRR
jgi:hypothetical protein